MTARRSKRQGQGRKPRLERKRKRPMDFDESSIASPHDGDLHIENTVNFEPAIKRIFLWCYNSLPSLQSIVSSTAEYLLPSRGYSSEFLDTKSELSSTKQELEEIRKKLDELEKKFDKSIKAGGTTGVPYIVPPPPPPPPPPLPVIIKKTGKPTAVSRKSTKRTTSPKGKPCVMLEDILKVKLRKTKTEKRSEEEKENKKPRGRPRITLSDLTSVTLKSSNLNNEEKNLGIGLKGTPKSALLNRTLRKTEVKRSPGGTPLVKGRMSTGTGPTPEFTRALQRKFRSVRTSPLVEDENSQSPILSGKNWEEAT